MYYCDNCSHQVHDYLLMKGKEGCVNCNSGTLRSDKGHVSAFAVASSEADICTDILFSSPVEASHMAGEDGLKVFAIAWDGVSAKSISYTKEITGSKDILQSQLWYNHNVS